MHLRKRSGPETIRNRLHRMRSNHRNQDAMINAYAIPGVVRTIEEVAANVWQIDTTELNGKTRKRKVVEARQVLMKYRRDILGQTTGKVGEHYNKDHATVIHACRNVDNLLETDKDFRFRYNQFMIRVKKTTIK